MKKTYKIDAKASENFYSLGRKSFLAVVLVISLFAIFSMTVSANPGVIRVPTDQPTIQAAINAVDDVNRTIEVNATTYSATETIDVNESDIIIRSVDGRAVISADLNSDYTFNITDQTNVTIEGFTIQEALVAGIYLNNSSDCVFSDNIVTNISTGSINLAYGILLLKSDNNSFSSMTIANITADDTAYGMYLNQSDDNKFEAVTIAPTISGDAYYEFYSDENSDENVATNVTLGNPTTISFTYANGIWIKRVADELPNPPNFENIGKYITAGNLSSNSWLFVNFRYSDDDVNVSEVDENSLKVWKYNGTSWVEDGWNASRVLDTTKNIVGVNITSFSLFAPLGSKLPEEPGGETEVSVTIKPETLNLAGKGRFTAFIQFPVGTDVSQIDLSTVRCEGAPAVKGIAAGNVYIAKFNRQALANILPGYDVTLTVNGTFQDNTPFEGSDAIRVIDQGKQIEPETGLTANVNNGQNKGPKNDNGKSKGNSNGKSKGKSQNRVKQ